MQCYWLAIVAIVALNVGCGSESADDAGATARDATVDAGPVDTGAVAADAQVDAGSEDAAPVEDAEEVDTGVVVEDSGSGEDAGFADASGGIRDIGPSGDGGGGGSGLAPTGEVWVAEMIYGQERAFTTFAEFVDRSAATLNVVSTIYNEPDSVCTLHRETVTSGQLSGIDTASVTVDLNNGRTLVYEKIIGGYFEPLTAPAPDLFAGSSAVVIDLISHNMPGTLAPARVELDPPGFIEIVAPFPGVPIFTSLGAAFNWMPATPPPNRMTVVELFDDAREVLLTCVLIGDPGSYFVPPAAVTDFTAQNPSQPWWIEVRYEYVVTEPVPVLGTTSTASVAFHTAYGMRWPAF